MTLELPAARPHRLWLDSDAVVDDGLVWLAWKVMVEEELDVVVRRALHHWAVEVPEGALVDGLVKEVLHSALRLRLQRSMQA